MRVEPDGIVRVINKGPTVPAEALARLKERFIRGQSRSAGSGLGLAIVETIVAQTGGKLELFSPAPGETDGFEARLTLTSAQKSERAPNLNAIAHDESIHPAKAAGSAGEPYSGCKIPSDLRVSIASTRVRPR